MRMIRKWHHSSLAVRDLDEAIRFYTTAFGFEVDFREDGMSEQIASIAGEPDLTCDIAQLRHPASEQVFELVAFQSARGDPMPLSKPFAPGAGHVAFVTGDLDSLMKGVEALGATRLGEVTLFEEGRCVYYREPAGSFFELEEECRA